MTLSDIRLPDAYLRVPRIEATDYRLLWHSGFWDGPESGMLLHRGVPYWFEVFAENEESAHNSWYRRFAILQLTPEEYAEEVRWHNLFREKVGTHSDYDEFGQRDHNAVRPRETWHEFYDVNKDRIPRDFSLNEVIGWFER